MNNELENPFSDYHSTILPININKNNNLTVNNSDGNNSDGISGNSIKERSKFFEKKTLNVNLEIKSNISSPSYSRKVDRMSRSMPTSPNSQLNVLQQHLLNNTRKSEEKLEKKQEKLIDTYMESRITANDIDDPFADSNALNSNSTTTIFSPKARVAKVGTDISKVYASSPVIPAKPISLRASSPNGLYPMKSSSSSISNSISSQNVRFKDHQPITPKNSYLSSQIKNLHISTSDSGLDSYGQNPFSPDTASPSPNYSDDGVGKSLLIKPESSEKKKSDKKKSKSRPNSSLKIQYKYNQNQSQTTTNVKIPTSISSPYLQSSYTTSTATTNNVSTNNSTSTTTNYRFSNQFQHRQSKIYSSSRDDVTLQNNSNITPNNQLISSLNASSTYNPSSQVSQIQTSSNKTYSINKPLITSPKPLSYTPYAYSGTTTQQSSTSSYMNQPKSTITQGKSFSTHTSSVYQTQTMPLQQQKSQYQPPPLPERSFTKTKLNGVNGTMTDGFDRVPKRRVVINIDSSKSNRAPPYASGYSMVDLSNVKHLMKQITICGQYLFCGNNDLSVYNTKDGKLSNTVEIKEKIKITSVLIIPGKYVYEEGNKVWIGTDKGEIYEVDIQTKDTRIIFEDSSSPIYELFYHNNKIWVISERRVMIWNRDYSMLNKNSEYMSFLSTSSSSYSFRDLGINEYEMVYVAEDKLWFCNNKTVTVLGPYPHINTRVEVNLKNNVGKITCIALADKSNNEIYTGHDDGKIIIWDSMNITIKDMFNVSYYKLTSILTVNNNHVWIGLATGKICVFDSSYKPWKKIKDFEAHYHSSICQLVKDPLPPYTSMANSASSVVASLSESGEVRFWDAFLSEDFMNNLIFDQELNYSERHDISVYLTSWNINSVKPHELVSRSNGKIFFDNWFKVMDNPDMIIVGLQELVNLESKTVNAKSFFKKAKKKSKKEKLDNCQQIWVDAIKRNLSENYGEYVNISCTQMVGLFLCVFIKESLKNNVTCQNVVTVETGLKGYHGNKGSIALRLFVDDSSFCIVNTHLAAHQDQVAARNHDIASILKETKFQPHDKPCAYVNGGDGSEIVDYENIFWFGDMNYRIDLNNLKREDIIELVEEQRWEELLSMDQFHTLHTMDPSFPLYFLNEGKIEFAPTFKYDINSDVYDTSEKQRVPSWCDRILYRGPINQLNYQRFECNASDHRPICSSFIVSVKKINYNEYQRTKNKCFEPCRKYLENMVNQEKVNWIMNRASYSKEQAQALLQTYNYDIDLLIENGELNKDNN